MSRKKKQEFVRFKEVSCPALNVRTGASTSNLIIKVLSKGSVVECDKNFEDADWEHIFSEPNIEGYCMKRYLEPLKQDTIAAFNMDPIIVHKITPTCDANSEEVNDNGFKEKEE